MMVLQATNILHHMITLGNNTMKFEINHRFDQQTFMILGDIEKLIMDSRNGTKVELSPTLENMYATDLKLDSLKCQLSMLLDLVRTANKDHQMAIRKVTSINTVCELFNNCKFPGPC